MITSQMPFFEWFSTIQAEMLVATKKRGVGEVRDSACEVKDTTFASHDRVQNQPRLLAGLSRSSTADRHAGRAKRPGHHSSCLKGHRIFPVQPFNWGTGDV